MFQSYNITYKIRASFLSHIQDWSHCQSPYWLVGLFSSSTTCCGSISLFQLSNTIWKKIQPVYDKYTVMYSYFYYFVFKMCINKSQSVNVSLRLELQQTEFKLESTEVSEKIEKSTKCACFIICNYLVFSLLSTQINKCQIIWFNTLNWLCWYLMIKVLQQYFILSHK